MKRFLLILFSFFCLPQIVFAAESINFPDLLTPPAIKNGTDESIHYLQNIFGVVDGVLHGSGSQIMGKMFGVFNAGALVLGVAIVVYIVIVGVLQTATEGETLGKQWNSLWIPFRAVMGIALLVPSGTGYSVLQIFMMWAVVQGVAVADSIWDAALSYLASGGVIIQQAQGVQANLSGEAKKIFQAEVCMFSIQRTLDKAKTDLENSPNAPPNMPNIPFLLSTVLPIDAATACKERCTIKFPGSFKGIVPEDQYKKWEPLEGICGSITWDKIVIKEGTAEQNSALQKLMDRDRIIAIQQLILHFQGPAQTAVQTAIEKYTSDDFVTNLSNTISDKILFDASSAYQGIMRAAENTISRQQRLGEALWIKDAISRGWLSAGSYYMALTHLNVNAQQATTPPEANFELKLPKEDKSPGNPGLVTILTNIIGGNSGGIDTSLKTFASYTYSDNKSKFGDFFNNLKTNAPPDFGGRMGGPNSSEANTMRHIIESISGVVSTLSQILLPLLGPFGAIPMALGGLIATLLYGCLDLYTSQVTNINPIIILSSMGYSMMSAAITCWVAAGITGAVVAGLVSLSAAGFSAGTGGAAAVVASLWIIPLIGPLLAILFLEGAVMAYYIPLIPFIIFLFASIGWIITIIEAMAAAPLIALGITHPEGSPVLGKADPAVLILVSIFIRPALMIIGLISGIIISYVGLWILNKGYWLAFLSNWGTFVKYVITLPFTFAVFFLIYILLVIGIMNMSFSLIEDLHSRVMKWLGATAAGGGEAQAALKEVRSGFEAGMKSVGESLAAGKGAAKEAGEEKERQRKAKESQLQ